MRELTETFDYEIICESPLFHTEVMLFNTLPLVNVTLAIHLLPCLFIFVNQLMQMLTDTTLNFNNVLNFEMNINITNY